MIKCNVTINGTVSRAATVRTNSEGQTFICFGVKATIPAKSGAGKQVEISVSKDGGETDIAPYAVGARVEMQGTLTFRKRSDNLYLNFHRGTIGKQVEEKTDKKGGKYLVFSAFSTEKDGDAFAFTWVRFIRFSAERETFLAPKTGITAKGKLELSAYLDKINIACRVEELAEWVKKEYNSQTQS